MKEPNKLLTRRRHRMSHLCVFIHTISQQETLKGQKKQGSNKARRRFNGSARDSKSFTLSYKPTWWMSPCECIFPGIELKNANLTNVKLEPPAMGFKIRFLTHSIIRLLLCSISLHIYLYFPDIGLKNATQTRVRAETPTLGFTVSSPSH